MLFFRTARRFMRLIWQVLLALLAGIGMSPGAAVSAQPSQQSVLVLDQSSAGLPFNTALASAIRTTLNAASKRPVSFYSENLDANRFFGIGYEEDFARFLNAKYRDRHIDIVVTVGVFALDFALRHRPEIWPSAPVIFTAIDEATASQLSLPGNVTGLTMQLTLRDMVSVARMVVPSLRKIALVGDPLDRQTFYRHFKDEIPRIAAQYEIIDLQNMRMADLKDRLGQLPDDAAVIYTGIYFDSEGVSYVPAELVPEITAWANRPVIVNVSSYLNKGAVGGYIVLADPIGQQTARVALRILDGESASNIPVSRVSSSLIFEWPALRRWKISEGDLPAGSEIRFRQFGIWEQYWAYILAAVAAIILQSVLISWLLLERRRRRTAEVLAQNSMSELAQMNRVATAGELSASIAHEVNQPLAAILAQAAAALLYLKKENPGVQEAQVAVTEIKNATNHAAEIIASVRALFKKESTERRATDLNQLVAGVVALTRIEAQKGDVQVETRLSENLPLVACDPVQVQQVILNLVMNAVEAMQSAPQRVLRIASALTKSGALHVSVEDSGPGVAPADIKRVFTPMFTTKSRGMGMGLAICRSIIESHNGRIWASAAHPRGAIFHFELPTGVGG
jgi:signal transduction histidine kinase